MDNLIYSEKHIYKYRCKLCSFAFKTEMKLYNHMQYHMIRESTKCHVCNRTFRSMVAIEKHLTKVHKNQPLSSVQVPCSQTPSIMTNFHAERLPISCKFNDLFWPFDYNKDFTECNKNVMLLNLNSVLHLKHVKKQSQLKYQNIFEAKKDIQKILMAPPINLLNVPEMYHSKPYKCRLCLVSFNKCNTLGIHLRSVYHQKKVIQNQRYFYEDQQQQKIYNNHGFIKFNNNFQTILENKGGATHLDQPFSNNEDKCSSKESGDLQEDEEILDFSTKHQMMENSYNEMGIEQEKQIQLADTTLNQHSPISTMDMLNLMQFHHLMSINFMNLAPPLIFGSTHCGSSSSTTPNKSTSCTAVATPAVSSLSSSLPQSTSELATLHSHNVFQQQVITYLLKMIWLWVIITSLE